MNGNSVEEKTGQIYQAKFKENKKKIGINVCGGVHLFLVLVSSFLVHVFNYNLQQYSKLILYIGYGHVIFPFNCGHEENNNNSKEKTQQMRCVCILCFILEFVRLILFDHYYFHEWISFTMGLILVAP